MTTKEIKSFFDKNGYIKIDCVLAGKRLQQIQDEVDFMINRSHKAGRRLEAHWGGTWREHINVDGDKQTRSVLSIHRVHEHSAALAQLMFDSNITDPVAAVVGSENLQLHHTLMHAKPPKIGAAFPLHQDYDYFPHKLDTMVAATLYLDDSEADNGCLHIIPGSHEGGYIDHVHDGSHHLPVDEYPIGRAIPVPMKAGDLLIFSYYTIHGSSPNISEQWRRMLLFEFRSPLDCRMTEPSGSTGQGIIVRGVHPNPVPKEGENY